MSLDWFPLEMERHQGRCPSAYWAEMPSSYFRFLMEELLSLGVTAAEFSAASRAVAQTNPHPSMHAAALLGRIRAERTQAAQRSRDEASAASRDCSSCGGTGFTLISLRPHRAAWCEAKCAISLWMRERADPHFNQCLTPLPPPTEPTEGVINNG